MNAPPIMREPIKSVSLADFWGRRWNGAFHQLAHELAFRPLLRKCGPAWATLTVFLISGLVHDLLISMPARGGYGLPTAYFLIQGLGVIFERTPWARKIGLGCGWRGSVVRRDLCGRSPPTGFSIPYSSTTSSCRCCTPSAQPERNMKTMNLTLLLQIAGIMHLGLICAGALMPRAVNLRTNIAVLPPFIQRLFWVYYAFIGLCVVSFRNHHDHFGRNVGRGQRAGTGHVFVHGDVLDIAPDRGNVCL